MNIRPWDEINEILPPLADHRLEALRRSIETHGYKGPPVYVLPDGRIIDGHHRWMITGGACPVEVLDVDEETGRQLAIAHNIARRQLSAEQIREVREAMKAAYMRLRPTMPQVKAAEAVGAPRTTAATWDAQIRKGNSVDFDVVSPRDSDEAVAETEISDPADDTPDLPDGRVVIPKSERVKILERAEAGETHAALAADYGTSKQRIGQIVRQERARREMNARVEEIARRDAPGFDGLYDVLVIDPPWPMVRIEREVAPTEVGFDYPTMSVEEIRELKLPAKADCHVFLWTTQKFLPDALDILSVWGLKYVCTFVWHKSGGFQPFNLPQYNCEFAIYAKRGDPKFVDLKDFFVCFNAPRGRHSEKPEEFYAVIRRVTDGRRLDMFSRREIEGFERWGNEA